MNHVQITRVFVSYFVDSWIDWCVLDMHIHNIHSQIHSQNHFEESPVWKPNNSREQWFLVIEKVAVWSHKTAKFLDGIFFYLSKLFNFCLSERFLNVIFWSCVTASTLLVSLWFDNERFTFGFKLSVSVIIDQNK